MEVIKQVPTTLNLLLLVFGCGLFLYSRGKRKAGRILLTLSVLVFLLSSTSILPRHLAGQIESHYSPWSSFPLSGSTDSVLGLVLGAGYSLDDGRPATSQLSTTTLARLVEALRICRQLPSSTLVTSGYSSAGLEPQASVVFRAAVELGFDSKRIEMLTAPSSTQEEAAAFVKHFGTENKLIIVTDALHICPEQCEYSDR